MDLKKTVVPEERASQRPLLDIRGLRVEYHTDEEVVYAVNGLDLTIGKGESVGLVGETGAGKTTTALSVLRLIASPPGKIMGGQIWFEGEDLLQAKPRRLREIRGSKISVIFQDPMTSLNPVYSVGDQIAEVIHQHEKCSREEGRKKAGDMLEMVGIPRTRYSEYPHQFSGGMKQRVVIAMALSCNPRLLIADEPTTALDVTIQAQILELMRGLKSKYDTAMILITHDLGVVADICDTVAIMYAGQIVEYGTVEEIYKDHRHPSTEGLFHSIPDIDTEQKKLKVIRGMTPDPTNIPSGCAFHPRCQYAMEICSQKCPEDSLVRENHFVKCFLNSEEGIN